jgi:hypothetical protein
MAAKARTPQGSKPQHQTRPGNSMQHLPPHVQDPQGPPPSVELLADLPVPLITRYRLEVFTTDSRGAGTDSAVFIEIHGMQVRMQQSTLSDEEWMSYQLDGLLLKLLAKLSIVIPEASKIYNAMCFWSCRCIMLVTPG